MSELDDLRALVRAEAALGPLNDPPSLSVTFTAWGLLALIAIAAIFS